MLDTLDHVIVAVRDLAAAASTYERLLGRRPSWHGRHPEGGTANCLFRLENTYLELLAAAGDGALAEIIRDWLGRNGEGPIGLAFGTADAETAAAELRVRGLTAADPVPGRGTEAASGEERRWRNVLLSPAETRGVWMFAIEHLSPPGCLPPAAAAGAVDAAVSGIDHVVVTTPSPEEAIALYRDRLGLRLALDRTFEQWGMRLLFFRIGGITVEIAHPLSSAGPAGDDRFWGISWRVPDVAAARERLAAAGFDVSEVRTGRRPGTRVFTVRSDTHGVATLLIGPA